MLLFCLFSCVSLVTSIGTTQSVAIKGKLTCDGKPASGVKLKLYDIDFGPLDDLMDQYTTDGTGTFSMAGHTSEVTAIDPRLNIYHDCEDSLPCQRRISIEIPKTYISTGPNARKTYDAGSIELAGKWGGETRDCLNRV